MSTMQRSVTPWFFPLLAGVVIVQGIHVIEHVIQLLQVFVFGVADDDAFGLLGYVFQFQGTEEWLHLVFNATYLLSLYLLVLPLRGRCPRRAAVGILGLRLGGSCSRAGTWWSTGSSSRTCCGTAAARAPASATPPCT